MIVFRTNAGANIGYGHIFRCIALAKAINKNNRTLDIKFIVNEACVKIIRQYNFKYNVSSSFDDIHILKYLKPKAIIFDSYLANNNYLEALKKIAKLVVFDDNNDLYDSKIPDLILNGNIHAKDLKYESQSLLGPKYLVMRSEYWDVEILSEFKNKMCITTGGSDFNYLMPRFIKSFRNLQYDREIIIGPGYCNEEIREIELISTQKDHLIYEPSTLIDIFNNSSVILSASGTSIYEILRLNKIPIIYTLADNQIKIADKLEENGVVNLGNYKDIDYINLNKIIEKHMRNIKEKSERLSKLYEIFDGQGAIRVAKYILEKVIE